MEGVKMKKAAKEKQNPKKEKYNELEGVTTISQLKQWLLRWL
jgi:hypothetical protein